MQKLMHSGNLILAGFGAAILLMSVLVYLTTRQNFEMVTDKYYEKELVYQQQINASQNAVAYANEFSASAVADSVVVQVPPVLSAALDSGSVYFYCPSAQNEDRVFPLKAAPNGRFAFLSNGWKPVKYIAKVSLAANGTQYYKELAFFL